MSIRAIVTLFGTPQNITNVQSLEFRSAMQWIENGIACTANELNEKRKEPWFKFDNDNNHRIHILHTCYFYHEYQASNIVKTLFNGFSTYTYNYKPKAQIHSRHSLIQGTSLKIHKIKSNAFTVWCAWWCAWCLKLQKKKKIIIKLFAFLPFHLSLTSPHRELKTVSKDWEE